MRFGRDPTGESDSYEDKRFMRFGRDPLTLDEVSISKSIYSNIGKIRKCPTVKISVQVLGKIFSLTLGQISSHFLIFPSFIMKKYSFSENSSKMQKSTLLQSLFFLSVQKIILA